MIYYIMGTAVLYVRDPVTVNAGVPRYMAYLERS